MINDLKKEADGRRVRLEQLERSIYTSLEELNQYQGPIQETEAQILHSENVLQVNSIDRSSAKSNTERKRTFAWRC